MMVRAAVGFAFVSSFCPWCVVSDFNGNETKNEQRKARMKEKRNGRRKEERNRERKNEIKKGTQERSSEKPL